VAVDVDEVLGQFLASLNEYCLEVHGERYAVGDYGAYHFAGVWGCSQEASNDRVHAFFQSEHFRDGVAPVGGARESLERLRRAGCDLVVVTSRQHCIEEQTRQWLEAHFPGIFSEVHFGNHFALEGASRRKSEICRDVGAHVLVDDNPQYALDCAEAGVEVVLFDWERRYPWSKALGAGEHERVRPVPTWRDAEAAILELAAARADLGTTLAEEQCPQ